MRCDERLAARATRLRRDGDARTARSRRRRACGALPRSAPDATEFGFDLLPRRDRRRLAGADALRFEVVHHFYSTAHVVRVRLKTRVATDPTRAVDSLRRALRRRAAFMERECHDMYGIVFRGNRDLRPILLYEGFAGHPLRKDYPKRREQPLVPYRDAELRTWTPPLPNPVRSDLPARRCAADSVIVNIGPSHPATHGTVQIIAELDGERCSALDVHCGYLHRGFEKECEDAHLAQPHPLRRTG